jgi:hypothetical protein
MLSAVNSISQSAGLLSSRYSSVVSHWHQWRAMTSGFKQKNDLIENDDSSAMRERVLLELMTQCAYKKVSALEDEKCCDSVVTEVPSVSLPGLFQDSHCREGILFHQYL